jgi:hypothetical protein
MKTRLTLLAFALSVLAAAPASAQLANFPVTPVPMMGEAPQSSASFNYGRGLNSGSGEENAFGLGYARTGARIGFTVGAAIVTYDNSEFTFGGQVGTQVYAGEMFDIGVQGGFGFMSPGDLTWLHFPIGASFTSEVEVGDGTVLTPWFMPRFSLTNLSGDDFDSQTEFDPGISAGVGMALSGGFGINAALDWLLVDGSDPFTLGLGVSYAIGGAN